MTALDRMIEEAARHAAGRGLSTDEAIEAALWQLEAAGYDFDTVADASAFTDEIRNAIEVACGLTGPRAYEEWHNLCARCEAEYVTATAPDLDDMICLDCRDNF